MKLKRRATLPALMGICLLFAACSQGPGGSASLANQAAGSPATTDVDVTPVVLQKLNTTVKLPAQLTAYEVVDIYAKVTGFLKWIKVDRGSRVKAGQQIALLEAPEVAAQQAEAESRFQSTELQLSAMQAKLAADLDATLPAAHRDFLDELQLSFTCGDFFFVHAGVRPGVPLPRQREEDD